MKKLIVALVVFVLAGLVTVAIGRHGDSSPTTPTATPPALQPVAVAQPFERVVLNPESLAASIEASQAGFASAQVAIVMAEDSWAAASYAAALGVPALTLGGGEPTEPVLGELDRLGVQVVLTDGVVDSATWGERTQLPLGPGAKAAADALGIRLTYVGDLTGGESVEEALTTLGTVIYDEDPGAASDLPLDVEAATRAPGSVVLTDGVNLAAVGTRWRREARRSCRRATRAGPPRLSRRWARPRAWWPASPPQTRIWTGRSQPPRPARSSPAAGS